MPTAPWRSTHRTNVANRSRSSMGGVSRSQLRMKVIQCQQPEASTIDTLQDVCAQKQLEADEQLHQGNRCNVATNDSALCFSVFNNSEVDLDHLCFKHHCITEAHVKLAANLLLTLVHFPPVTLLIAVSGVLATCWCLMGEVKNAEEEGSSWTMSSSEE